MRRRRSSAGALVLLLAATSSLRGQVADPEVGGATFLLLPVGGRAAALGQAAVADWGTGEAAFWNPAGLARIARSEVTIHHASTFASNNTVLSGFVTLHKLGVVGASAYLVDFGSQEVVPGPGQPVGRISPKNIEILASYAAEVGGGLAIGVNYKLIQFRQDCSGDCGPFRSIVGTTHGIDLGLQYVLGRRDNLTLGVALQHAGFKLQLENRDQADPLPTRIQAGFAYRVFLPTPAGTADGLDARLLFDLQGPWNDVGDPDARVGFEVGFEDLIRLRSGYAFLQSETRGPSIGLGLKLGRVAIDFARIFFDSANFNEPVHITFRALL